MRPTATALAIVLVLVIAFSRPASGVTYVTMDGNWWNAIPSDAKLYVVEGMMVTFQQGYLIGAADASHEVVSDYPQIAGSASGRKALDKINEMPEPKFSKHFGAYSDEISEYYANYPDMISKVEVQKIFGCLFDGAPPKCLENMTANLRQSK